MTEDDNNKDEEKEASSAVGFLEHNTFSFHFSSGRRRRRHPLAFFL